MKQNYLLRSAFAEDLYGQAAALPIYDYHCHLSPREIREDAVFSSVGEIMLGGDHYKWRLMRAAGVPEAFVTGDAPWEEKFRAYAGALFMSPGNPLYHWTAMELSRYFGIEEELTPQTADGILKEADRVIRERALSPRKLILQSNVRYIGTTDDPADSLDEHRLLAEDKSFPVKVSPSFRTDRLMQISSAGYPAYLSRLGAAANTEICDLASFLRAVTVRLDDFCAAGCRFTDVGIEHFPRTVGSEAEAACVLGKALSEKEISKEEQDLFAGFLFVFLGREYRKRGLVMQWHVAVRRNANDALYRLRGADCGGDCIGDEIPNGAIASLLNAIEEDGGLPETILYALNPAMAARLCSLAGSFRGVRCGAAWWFCDHLRGIEEQLHTVAELGCLGTFPGMLTDSRSFLSYARHDYYRRILCSMLGDWAERGECSRAAAEALVEPLCCGNTKKLIGDV